MGNPSRFDFSVYFVADPAACGGRSVVDVVRQAIQGGVTMVQLRNKIGHDFLEQARAITSFITVPFIINDNIEIARAVDADGVHLGQEDINPQEARKILGPDKIIGVTAFTEEHFKNIDPAIVDYAGTGPVYPTLTKPDKKIMGVAGLARLVQRSPVPVVGIGGITPQTASIVMKTGVAGVAMMRAISEHGNPEQAARDFVRVIDRKAA